MYIIIKLMDYKFDCGYILWYHSVTDKSWSLDSYKNICVDLPGNVIRTARQLWEVYNELSNVFTAGFFFLLKEGISPRWEEPPNDRGGYWSFRIRKDNADKIWIKLSAALVGNTITEDKKLLDTISGISISSKIANCVIKVWNTDKNINYTNKFTNEIEYLQEDKIRYNIPS